MFDVSHLGTVRVTGPDALDRLQAALTNDLAKIAPGRTQYTHLLDPTDASVLDDIIVWWVGDTRFDVMPNASNTARVVQAIGGEDLTPTRAVLAVQGPQARARLARSRGGRGGGAAGPSPESRCSASLRGGRDGYTGEEASSSPSPPIMPPPCGRRGGRGRDTRRSRCP